jgi:basic amino acid/polyamine antiporter, APA family
MARDTTAAPLEAQPELKRAIGPKLLFFFVLGDVLGTGIYALTGSVAGRIGGALWVPFLVAFVLAFLTAFSYLELVGKYPRAAGAALYTNRAFRIPFLTFMVAFTVMCSGITSASAAARAFGATYLPASFDITVSSWVIAAVAVLFIVALAVINFIGVSESVKANVVLTCIELSGLLIIIGVGIYAVLTGMGEPSRLTEIQTSPNFGVLLAITAATSLAFFAMVGFEDSVNMAEECHEPKRIFPKVLLAGLLATGLIYVLVSISAIALVPADALSEGDTPLLQVVEAGAPGFPIGLFGVITMFAVANSALINMLMASRLVYGMSNQGVLPPLLGKVHPTRRTPTTAILFTTALAFGLITFVGAVPALGGTTALLLLGVFTVVNIAVLVLRKDPVDADHFRTPTVLPVVGALACGFLATPWAGRPSEQYRIAAVLLGIGVLLWVVTVLVQRRTGRPAPPLDPDRFTKGGPVN